MQVITYPYNTGGGGKYALKMACCLAGVSKESFTYWEHLKMVTGIHDLMAMPTGSLVLVVCQGSPDRIETLPWWFGLVAYLSR